MPERHWIDELPQFAGQAVTVCGWTVTTRSSGKIAFVVLRDGTGLLQAVISKKDVAPEVWDAFGKLTQETTLAVSGTLRADARAMTRLGGFVEAAREARRLGRASAMTQRRPGARRD